MIRTIGASIAVTVCFFYLGCGSVQMANASGSAKNTPLTIATKLFPSAIAGTPYVVALDATGGTPGYTWSITAGNLPAGMSLSSTTGIISGTPTAGGTFSIGVTLSDAENPVQERTSTVTIAVAPPALTIVASTLPSATDGTAYSQTLQATGGTPSYAWSVTAGALPAGLKLMSASGIISGMPTASGTANFTVTVRDNERPVQTQSLAMKISVAPPSLKIMTLSLSSAVDGVSYSQALKAKGGTPAYAWTIVSGNLPSGLTLAPSTGAISGKPTASGTATFAASVSDNGNPAQTTTMPLTIVVAPAPLKIIASTLPSVIVGTVYSQDLQVSGGTAPYIWTIASGQLPSGLVLTSSTGAISGTPTTSGTAAFVANVTDSSIPMMSASVTKAIIVKPTPLVMKPTALPEVRVGESYSQALQASGGTTPYLWSIASGKLPAGLSLGQSTGIVSGTPTTSGTATFKATITDSGSPSQSASATSLVLVVPTSLVIMSSSLPAMTAGTAYSQALQARGGTAPYKWSIASGKLPSGLTLASASGTVSGTPTAAGAFTFTSTVMDTSNPAQTASTTTAVLVAPTTAVPTAPTALIVTTQTLPQIIAGTPYSQTLQATGGTLPYTWSITSGQLPGGLSISTSGVISGTSTSNGTSVFTVTASDSGSPTQSNSASLKIVGIATPLSITFSALSTGTDGTPYSQMLQATGGTPAYTWSITSGSLPAGLTLSATTGVIAGTPTSSGTSNFTATVTDNGSPVQAQSAATSIAVSATQTISGPGTTWFIRSDGGTRFSSNMPIGQCDGMSDAAYPGAGVNQHCAFNDLRFMWDDKSGMVGAGAWVMAGGDTVLIRGCAAGPGQSNPSNPDCRLGWDAPTGTGANLWCYGVGSYSCINPPIPAGTAAQHTRILGQNYANCSVNGATNPKLYESNLTQIFGGFSQQYTFNLQNTQNVDVQCIELTTHNGQCTMAGSPSSPRGCNGNQPLDDYAQNGFQLNNKTANVTFQDVYVHGFNASGFVGPIGGAITMNRVFDGFNAFAGWNFDDGSDTPDSAGSSISANYVTMIGNGCYEQYPIVNSFPARACYDDVSNGFGDAWSGQDTNLDAFTCIHCVMAYNVKDAFMGPHTLITKLLIENSESYGNMGAQWKWNNTPNATTTFIDNLTVGNCLRFSDTANPIPGAAQSFASASGLPGAYLSDYCRAAGNTVAINSQQNSSVLFANNTFVDYLDTVVLLSCGPSNNNQDGMCATTPFVFTNNIFLGYYVNGAEAPGLFYINDPSITVTQSNNIEYMNRTGTGETCGVNGNICSDPLLVNEPIQQAWTSETFLDNFDFHLNSGSPAIGAGATYSASPSADYYGTASSNPPVIGAVAP